MRDPITRTAYRLTELRGMKTDDLALRNVALEGALVHLQTQKPWDILLFTFALGVAVGMFF